MTLDSKQKKAILGVGIAICLLISGTKLYSFYKSLQLPFQVGECFKVVGTQLGDVNFKVVENNKTDKTTDAVGTINAPFGLEGVKIQVPVRVSFDDLRNDPSVKAAKCEEQ
jgi:hypothetical protein